MATIRVKSGARGVTYEVQVRMAGMRPVTKTFKTKFAAKTWARDTEAKLAKGDLSHSEAERRTLAEACDVYLTDHPDISKDHRRVVVWWKNTHGRRPLARVTTPWLTDVRRTLAAEPYEVGPANNRRTKRRANGTVNRTMTYGRVVLKYIVQLGWMPAVPKLEKLSETEAERVRFLDQDELTALVAALRNCRERVMLPFVMCALSSGARAGELMAMEWKRLDLKKGIGLIHTSKNKEGRQLFFRGEALDTLREYARVRVLGSPGVFLLNSGAPLTHSKYGKLFRECLDEAGIENFRFHDLRHTAASYLAQNGASLLEIQKALGHKTAAMTMRYAHLTESHVEAVVDRVMSAKLRFTPNEGGAR